MIIETKEALDRYNISRATLDNRRDIITKHNGILPRTTGGSSQNLYKTSVLDHLARQGMLGTKATQAILNLDQRKTDEKEVTQ